MIEVRDYKDNLIATVHSDRPVPRKDETFINNTSMYLVNAVHHEYKSGYYHRTVILVSFTADIGYGG